MISSKEICDYEDRLSKLAIDINGNFLMADSACTGYSISRSAHAPMNALEFFLRVQKARKWAAKLLETADAMDQHLASFLNAKEVG